MCLCPLLPICKLRLINNDFLRPKIFETFSKQTCKDVFTHTK